VLTTHLQLILLLLVANGAPLLAGRLFGERGARRVDFGLDLRDGQPLFGASCTWRGVAAAVVACAATAWLLGLGVLTGIAIGTLAMAGDLASSLLKRRLRMPAGSMAFGLDQVPEALFPLLWAKGPFALGWGDVAGLTLVFLVLELLLSRLLYRLKLRPRPY
jgi:hypothetical protein